jgi:hypothetical protein
MRATPADPSTPQWRKSSHSGGAESSACVEVAFGTPGLIPVRDSKNPHGPTLTFTATAWRGFISALRQGEPPTV